MSANASRLAETATSPAGTFTGVRIAFLGLGHYSGASPIAFHLASALAEQHELRAFIDREAANLDTWQRSSLDIDVRRVYETPLQALTSVATRRRVHRLAAEINEFAPDVAVVPFFHLWIPFLIRHLRCPTLVFVHDPVPHPGLVGKVMHMLERRAVTAAGHVVIHTSDFKQTLCDAYGVTPEKVSIVPIGPLSGYLETPIVHGDQSLDGPPFVLFFGRMEPYKGLDVLLDAVPLVRGRVPDACFYLSGGGEASALMSRARLTPGVRVDNRWIDEDEIPGLFARAALLVLPYTTATQSGVIPVAATFALPVVATETGGLPEQLADGRCGVLVPVGDPVALATAVADLLEDPERARELGAALKHEYQTERSWSAIARAVVQGCEQAAANSAR